MFAESADPAVGPLSPGHGRPLLKPKAEAFRVAATTRCAYRVPGSALTGTQPGDLTCHGTTVVWVCRTAPLAAYMLTP